jgi:hypothetical protein
MPWKPEFPPENLAALYSFSIGMNAPGSPDLKASKQT